MRPFFIKRRPTKYQESWSRIVLCTKYQVPGTRYLVQDSTLQVLANAGSPEWVEAQMLPRLVEV